MDGCSFTDPFVNELGAHLIDAHGYERDAAREAAKKVQSQAGPVGLDAHGIKTHVEKPEVAEQETETFPLVNVALPLDRKPAPGEWGNGAKHKRRGTQVPDIPVTCPRCPNEYPRRFALIQHLVDTHGLNGTEAMNAAQQAERDAIKPSKENPMATCSACGGTGHRKGGSNCPKTAGKLDGKPCGWCKRIRPEHSATCKYRSGASRPTREKEAPKPRTGGGRAQENPEANRARGARRGE